MKKNTAMLPIDTVKIRMYRHGFGDCFLLQFFSGDSRTFTMLIDCGLKLNDHVVGVPLEDVCKDIRKVLSGPDGNTPSPKLDVLVVTHEHWDHVSGFAPEKEFFDSFSIGRLWFAWTEDPDDADAKVLNAGLVKRVKALQLATDKLKKSTENNKPFFLQLDKGEELLQFRQQFNAALDGLLGFFGAVSLTQTPSGITAKDTIKISMDTQNAIDHIRALALKNGTAITYFNPGELVGNIEGLTGVRMYILGPPKNKLLNKSDPSSGSGKEVYFGDSSLTGFVDGVLAGADRQNTLTDESRPFGNVSFVKETDAPRDAYFLQTYYDGDSSWRRIEEDWLDMAGALAVQMDSDTNNTSLVLAIELTGSEKVLLFPGDAQVGNWLSWHDLSWQVKDNNGNRIVRAENLLNNTVFYKVGHHASHNATLKEKGLEMMTHPDLVAFVPEKNDQYRGIPYSELIETLKKKTKGRMIVSADSNYPAEAALSTKPAGLTGAEWKNFTAQINLEKLYIEYIVKG